MTPDCKHEVVERDITNMTRCIACGEELGIGYAAWERPATREYWGIDRSQYEIGTNPVKALMNDATLNSTPPRMHGKIEGIK